MHCAVCYLSPHETRSLCASASGLVPGEPAAGAPVVAVVDYPDESYVLATVPIMRGRDAALLRRRRLQREFPGATLTALAVLRHRASDGVSDAVMMAVNGGPALQETLASLGNAHALRAVTTPALLAGEWLRRAKVAKRRVLIVLPTPAGVRLMFLDDARPTLSRLTGMLSPASTATEIARTVQYLQNSQRVERGENVELWFWGMDDATAAACLPSGVAAVPAAAPRVAGLPDPERDGLDALLQLAAQSPGRLQLAPDELRLGWLAGGVERNGRRAAAAALLLSVGLAGLLEWRTARLDTEVKTWVAERAAIEADAAQLNATLQQRGLSLADVATLPDAARALARGALSFDDVLRVVGTGFGAHPDVLVQRIDMRAAATEAPPVAAPVDESLDTGDLADPALAAAAPDSVACATGPADANVVVEVEFSLAAGLDVRRRDAALGAVRGATGALEPWRAGAAARSIGRRDPIVATDEIAAGADAARWSVCLRREATS
jgi:hypothetical protein